MADLIPASSERILEIMRETSAKSQAEFDKRPMDAETRALNDGQDGRINQLLRPMADPNKEAADFTKARQDSAMGTPGFQRLTKGAAGYALPLAAAASAFIPGPHQGVAAQTAISGAATLANQLLGGESTEGSTETTIPGTNKKVNLGSLGLSMAIPGASKVAVSSAKSIAKGATEFAAPSSLREAGVEAVAERVGAPARSAARVVAGTLDTDAAYQVARSVTGNVPTRPVHSVITQALLDEKFMANPNALALKTLKGLERKFTTNTGTLTHGEVLDEAQRLSLTARGLRETDPVAAATLRKVRETLMDASDAVSPALREANSLYRTRLATEDLIEAARTPNPGVEVRKLLEGHGGLRVAKSLGLSNEKEINEVYAIADAMGDVASSAPSGVFSRGVAAAMAYPAKLLATPKGRYFMRQLIKPTGKLTVAGLAAANQFGRAWEAQEADRNP